MIETSILIMAAVMGLAVYHSPKALRHLAARSLTRAQVIEAMKVAHDAGLKDWKDRLGIEDRAARVKVVRMEGINA